MSQFIVFSYLWKKVLTQTLLEDNILSHYLLLIMRIRFEFAKKYCFLGLARASQIYRTKVIVPYLNHLIDISPCSIYSCSIRHIWEHEICHLGCWAEEKFLKQRNFCLSMLLFLVVFSTFCGQKKF